MQTRITHEPNGTGLCWFVDVNNGSGWKNVGCYRTKAEAEKESNKIKTK